MPEEQAMWHKHHCDPTGVYGRTVYGRRLVAGDVLEASDVFDSTAGEWHPCPCPGVTLATISDTVTWVRPCAEPPAIEPSPKPDEKSCEVDPFI